MERPHIVQPVRQLHDQDPDIGRNRDHQFLEVLGLFCPVGAQLHLTQLGDAIDQGRNLRRKERAQLFECGRCILDRIMQ